MEAGFKKTVNRPFALAIRGVALGGLATLLVGCGNTWMSSTERKETPAALMKDAQWAYDKGEFEKALSLYERVLAKDPNNLNARVGLTYTYNAKAGLTPFDIVSKLTKLKSPTTSAAGAPTSKAAAAVNSFAELAGLTPTERAALSSRVFKSMDELRQVSPRFSTLHTSWRNICMAIPGQILTNVLGSEPELQKVFAVDACQGGAGQGVTLSAAGFFAAAVESMAQAAGLLQAVVDKDDNGELDLVQEANKLAAEVNTLRDEANKATDLATMTLKMKQLNEKMAQFVTVSVGLRSEMVGVTITHFRLVSELTRNISMPDNIKKRIAEALVQFDAALVQMQEFMNRSTNTNSKGQAKIRESATKASATLESLYVKQQTQAGTDEAKKAENEKNMRESCTNFDALKSAYGLPADVQRPASCQTVGASLWEEAPTANLVPEPLPEGAGSGYGLVDSDESVEFGITDHTEHDAFVEFVRWGDGLRGELVSD